MHISVATTVTTLLATAAVAAPAPASAQIQAMTAQGVTWTIESMTRLCDHPDNVCHWSFGIKADGKTTPCEFDIKRQDDNTPASHSNHDSVVECGAYDVTAGWSGQFGPGKGFTTLSVVNQDKKQIAWPAYTDEELKGGDAVKPDRAYPVQKLPGF